MTELHWAEGPWPGKLALAARPRGGDWLADEMGGWRRSGVDTVVSLLTHQEEMDLNLLNEAAQAGANGMAFVSLPIADRQAPFGTALSAARGIAVPETPEQLLWIDDYAAAVGASAL